MRSSPNGGPSSLRPTLQKVTLHPRIAYGGDKLPSSGDEERLHHQAHEQCFVSNSVKSEVLVEPRI